MCPSFLFYGIIIPVKRNAAAVVFKYFFIDAALLFTGIAFYLTSAWMCLFMMSLTLR